MSRNAGSVFLMGILGVLVLSLGESSTFYLKCLHLQALLSENRP